jgi:hypothetical protein
MIVDAQIAVTIVIASRPAASAHHEQGGALLSATIASGSLPRRERGEEPVGQFGVFHFLRTLVCFRHCGQDWFPCEKIPLHGKILPFPLAGESDAFGAGMRCGATLSVDDADLTCFALWIGPEQRLEDLARRLSRLQEPQPVRPKTHFRARLRRHRADFRAGPRDDAADPKIFAFDGHAEITGGRIESDD